MYKSEKVSYHDVLKKIRKIENGTLVDVVTNVTLDPFFSDFFKYYSRDFCSKNVFLDDFLVNKADNTDRFAAIVLHFPDLGGNIIREFCEFGAENIQKYINMLEMKLDMLLSKASKEYKGVLICNFTLLPIVHAVSGDGVNQIIDKCNSLMNDIAGKYINVYVVDLYSASICCGLFNFYDARNYYSYILPYSEKGCSIIAEELSDTLRMLTKESKKCVICDCDEVLWGGIIGDDGVGGICIGNTAKGNFYRDFQVELLDLYKRGILLCLCSKNQEQTVLDALDNNPNMLLKRKHISCYRINYNNKADNIRKIAAELNIGLESMVFIDDSIREIELVKRELPQVTLICLDVKKFYDFLFELHHSKLFSFVNIDSTDRSKYYNDNKEREKLKSTYTDMEAYQKYLDTKVIIMEDINVDFNRVSELSYRTHQFNMSNRKYTAKEIANLIKDENYNVLTLQAKDVLGDMGVVCACILKKNKTANEAVIESMYLSCRAFGLNFENDMLNKVREIASDEGITIIKGIFNETEKNSQFREFYKLNNIIVLTDENM